nr:MAG TPA: hypothetical protein [Caudoviricetes sp.]
MWRCACSEYERCAMVQLLIGMLLGAMVATPTGRSIGNQIGDAALAEIKKAMPKPTAESEEENETH